MSSSTGRLPGVGARRSARMLALAVAATADSDAAAIWHKNLQDRRRGMEMLAADLAATGRLRSDHERLTRQ